MFGLKKTVRDERIVLGEHRIGYEAYLLVTMLLAASILIKRVAYGIPFSSVWTESSILIIGAVYVVLRSVLAGIFTAGVAGDARRSKQIKSYLITCLLGGIIAGLAVGIRNFFLYDFAMWKILLVVLPIVSFTTPFLFTLVLFLEKIALRRADAMIDDKDDDQ